MRSRGVRPTLCVVNRTSLNIGSLQRDGARQLSLFALAYLVYLTGRWLTVGDQATALAHAHAVVDLERTLGMTVERRVQDAFREGIVEALMSYVYLAAQMVVVPAALLLTYRRSRSVYLRLRDTVLAAWLISIPVYAVFPCAPPRLAASGMSDTVSHASAVALTGRSTIFYNQFAAIPSLHVGFACAVGTALAAVARHRATRALTLLWGPLVTLVVVATANHYVLDAVAGLIVTAAGYGAGRLVGAVRAGGHRIPPPPM